ncbi:hypothetical protein GIB67_034580 [Kingdonia uniflora]|uniref:Uncharacterized protein n=1 Tax=Kingdonia uniflora TaxID=39325 RepID=A0A7J7MY59_9MAGN|nr:hypothetical protein GIB67_034580 [Kingdonia uniflora]
MGDSTQCWVDEKKKPRKQSNPKPFGVSSGVGVEEAIEEGKGVEEEEEYTSTSGWKTDKVIYRKGNVWRVREETTVSRKVSWGRDKRKASQLDKESGVIKKKKKKKWKLLLSSPPSTSKEVGGREEHVVLLTEDSPRNDDTRKIYKAPPEILGKISKKRHPFSRLPRKLVQRHSSLLDIQDALTMKKI